MFTFIRRTCKIKTPDRNENEYSLSDLTEHFNRIRPVTIYIQFFKNLEFSS